MDDGQAEAVIFDPEPLRRLEAHTPGIRVAVLEVFIRDLRLFLERAPAVFAAGGDSETMRRAAHKLKGSSGSVGARELHRCALRLEEACRNGGVAPPPLVEAVRQAAQRFLALEPLPG